MSPNSTVLLTSDYSLAIYSKKPDSSDSDTSLPGNSGNKPKGGRSTLNNLQIKGATL